MEKHLTDNNQFDKEKKNRQMQVLNQIYISI